MCYLPGFRVAARNDITWRVSGDCEGGRRLSFSLQPNPIYLQPIPLQPSVPYSLLIQLEIRSFRQWMMQIHYV